jgi:2-C-methyl-D-erythritol 4-phosphate cytidylyltransferase
MAMDARDVCAVIIAAESDGELIWRAVTGKPLIAWSVAAFAAAPSVTRILLVVPAARIGSAQAMLERESSGKVGAILPAGGRRRESVAAALGVMPDECAVVAVSDATWPLITPALIEDGAALARVTGVAVPVEPVKETIKRVRDGVIVGGVPRERLARAQAPQCFVRARIGEAYQRAAPQLDPPDEATLLLTVGLLLHHYAGDAENIRVASVDDLPFVEELLRRRLG